MILKVSFLFALMRMCITGFVLLVNIVLCSSSNIFIFWIVLFHIDCIDVCTNYSLWLCVVALLKWCYMRFLMFMLKINVNSILYLNLLFSLQSCAIHQCLWMFDVLYCVVGHHWWWNLLWPLNPLLLPVGSTFVCLLVPAGLQCISVCWPFCLFDEPFCI